jgi:hypothetical protein
MATKFSLRPSSLPFSIGLFLFSIYLLSFSGRFHVMDELAVFTAGYNLARNGRADINQLIWTNHWTPNPPGVWGVDGNLYTKKPPGISFVSAPLIGLGGVIPGLSHVHVALLTNTLVTAITAGLLFVWLFDLGFSRATASLASLGYGLCTIAWVYARMFWESSLLALVFLVAVWSTYRGVYLAQAGRRWLWLLLCGIAVAIGLTLRFEAALIAVLFGIYLLASWPGADGRDESANTESLLITTRGIPRSSHPASRFWHLIRLLVVFLAPSLVIGLGLLYFNFVRFGDPIETGYTQEILFHKPWVGAFGLLLSPGRGLFFYAPLMLLFFFGLRPAWHRLPRAYYLLIASTCLCYWLFYGSWFAWGGTWGWGPRFLLPIVPLLMVFVAEAVEWLIRRKPGLGSRLLWSGVGILALISLVVNLLGISVDFNEHFSRLGTNQDFVFNWAVFPPLAHWHILQEGLVDLIWLRPYVGGLTIEWSVLIPALVLILFSTVGLVVAYRDQRGISRDEGFDRRRGGPGAWTEVSRLTYYALALMVASGLTLVILIGAARIPLTDEQAKSDVPVLDTLAVSAQPGDALLVPMPAFGDVQEISTRLMAYLKPALPTYAWIETEPRAIQPDERERVQRVVQTEARRVWLFERWLTPGEATTKTAARFNQEAFPIWERWFAQSGRLSLFALADDAQSVATTPLDIPFQAGLVLVESAVWSDGHTVQPGDILKLRLTWQAAVNEPAPQSIPAGGITAFAQLLDQATPPQTIVQNDRLLVDLQNLTHSPLRPGQTIQQGYGLQLPDNLAPGSYPLIVGLYDSATGERLTRADDSPDDFLYLTNVVVD